MIDVRRLQVFMAVVDTGSFTGAAARLFMSQPAVSQQVALLERELGEPLFIRTARGVRLNEAGVYLRDRARGLLEQATALERDFHALHDGLRRVTIGAFPTAGIDLLPQAFRLIMAERPDIRLALKQLDTVDPVSLLRDQEADLVLMFEYDIAPRPVDEAFVYVRLADDPVCVVLPADHRLAADDTVALADLADESWVLRSHRAPYERIHDQMFRRAAVTPKTVFWTDDYQSLQGLVAARVGVSLVPSLAIAQHRPEVVVRPLSGPHFTRQVSLVSAPEFARTDEYRAVLDALRAVTG